MEISEKWICDYELVQKAITDDESWNMLYDISYDKVYNYAKKFCWSIGFGVEEAYEVTVEAFGKCYIKLSDFKGTSLFSTWVCGFARNTAYQYRDKKIRYAKKQQKLGLYLEEMNNVILDPEKAFIHKETHMRLWIAYYNLSLLHRTILDCKILGLTTNRQMLSRLKKLYGKNVASIVDCEAEKVRAINFLKIRFFSDNIYIERCF